MFIFSILIKINYFYEMNMAFLLPYLTIVGSWKDQLDEFRNNIELY